MSAKRAAFVTGASSGIGAATALALARDGFDVAVSATRIDNLLDTVKKLEASGMRALAVALDLRSQSSIEAAMAAVLHAFSHADVLVNNAAGIPFRKAAVDLSRGVGRCHRNQRYRNLLPDLTQSTAH